MKLSLSTVDYYQDAKDIAKSSHNYYMSTSVMNWATGGYICCRCQDIARDELIVNGNAVSGAKGGAAINKVHRCVARRPLTVLNYGNAERFQPDFQ